MIIYYYNILQCLQIQYYVLFEFYSSLSHGINVLNSRGNFLNIYWKISTCDAQPLSGHSVTSPPFPRMRFIRNLYALKSLYEMLVGYFPKLFLLFSSFILFIGVLRTKRNGLWKYNSILLWERSPWENTKKTLLKVQIWI